MVSKQELKSISLDKLHSAQVLFKSKKYDTSIYIVGYAIELALKYKICKILKLEIGFPENKLEFENYILDKGNDLGIEIKNLRDIRNHNLQKLLYYSGQEYTIKSQFLDEWTSISFWYPELRYKSNYGNKELNKILITSVEKVLNLIFKL